MGICKEGHAKKTFVTYTSSENAKMVNLLPSYAFPVAVLAHKIWGHGPMASAVARAYNGGLGQSPQRSPGAESLVRGSRGETPLKLKHFWFWGIEWKPQICPLFETLKTQRHKMCVLSLQKNHGRP